MDKYSSQSYATPTPFKVCFKSGYSLFWAAELLEWLKPIAWTSQRLLINTL